MCDIIIYAYRLSYTNTYVQIRENEGVASWNSEIFANYKNHQGVGREMLIRNANSSERCDPMAGRSLLDSLLKFYARGGNK